MNKALSICLLFILPFSLSSCSSKLLGGKHRKKKHDAITVIQPDTSHLTITKADTTVTVPDNTAAIAVKMLIDQLTPLWKNRLDYKTFSGKAKINFEGPDGDKDFSANFRIRKDSVIWVHVTALGFVSAARILVTRDSFFMLNFLQKEVTKISLKDASKVLPAAVDFPQLQNLIVGEPLHDGTITNVATQPKTWNVTVEDTTYLQHITYNLSDSNISTAQMTTVKPNGPIAVIDYSNYTKVNDRKIAEKRLIRLQNGDKNYAIDMNFGSTEFDKQLEFPFSIPKNYSLKNPK